MSKIIIIIIIKKATIAKTWQNNKCMLCGDRDKMINDIIRKCSKLVQNTQLSREGDLLGIVQESEIWLYEPVVYEQPRICPGE